MIDNDGYRPNVGIIICNRQSQVLWARRFGQNSWQFPQGGINNNETPEQAMFRELNEEVGLLPKDVKILSVTNGWLRYKLPKRMVRWDNEPVCIGQKQKWFLLELISDASAINLSLTSTPEFDDWKWVSYWYPVRQVIAFKRDVYRKAMKEFSLVTFSLQNDRDLSTPVSHEAHVVSNKSGAKKRFNFFAHKRKNRQRVKK
ncbi:putative (di)nucleoside polyphosphate hydrolase [Orbus hercynius]|uniref:RNA pyrophosphohydrolase n=1 Tax=Orbus hercynius TaxID=593135 RepID=A0A495RHR2_9GAMM|nr:RNA pyrophosphohydrolase [Orbus hercynius]RKS86804.1 putative (di)nucleoside polyphosphate hydrolase [Orbus hercynius]